MNTTRTDISEKGLFSSSTQFHDSMHDACRKVTFTYFFIHKLLERSLLPFLLIHACIFLYLDKKVSCTVRSCFGDLAV